MNILMVDDEKYVLEGILYGVEWNRLPFENRYIANCAAAAREIMEQVPIHVLLCDIEMPQESGLDLLASVRTKNKNMQVLFLTSHADFDYAKQAIHLDSFEYLLKPIDYIKLTEILYNAAAKASEKIEQQRKQQYGEYWLETERGRKESFWNRIISGRHPLSPAQISDRKQQEMLSYHSQQKFVVIAMHIIPKIPTDWRDDAMIYYRLENAFYSCLPETGRAVIEALWKESSDLWFGVLGVKGAEEDVWSILGRTADHMCKELKRNFREFAIYLSELIDIGESYGQAVRIRQMMFNNIAYGNGVFFVCNFNPAPEQSVPFDQKEVEEWFLLEDEEKLYHYIDQLSEYLGTLRDLSNTTIHKVILEWLQVVFLYLYKKQADANRVFASPEYKKLYEEADKSLASFKDFLYYIVKTSIEFGKLAGQSDDIIQMIEKYVREHLADNLTRASFAEIVYMNADYLAHLFKKAKGVSLIRYINNCRLERARELLLTTDETIYNVALMVGYPTSSYFAKQFKESFGIGPNEFRKVTMKI